ncbi:PH domain-containing protein [Luteimonas sp. BDR2-5]|uniref:PH domain-containing protein n=1 Tax=Proluteimonas luteida TaxID=2878685 RepID=UPI001E52AD30|nr:PH domain-containing protein [Luteimonas sp. BDR2-5]MCD9027361.1 PH domain-containing protein [Luteimonas sp. BDR2-5]
MTGPESRDAAPPLPAPAPAGADTPALPTDSWQPLPVRARTLATISALLGTLLPLLVALVPGLVFIGRDTPALAVYAALLVLLPAWTVWIARRRWLRTRWRLDDDGFGVRRGHLWRRDTRVPGTRVQHLDIQRGPLERVFGLSTLTVHTAGTHNNSVVLAGLDHVEAERLRDALASRAARDGDTDDEGDDDDAG